MLGILNPATEIAIALGLLTGIVMVIVSMAFADANSRRFTRRLQEVTTRKPEAARAAQTQQRSLTRRESATPGIDRLFRLLPRRELLVERLGKTGREISVGQYMMATIVVVVIMIGVLFVFGGLGPIPSGAFGLAVGLFIPHYLVG